jgi:transposase
MKPIHIEIRKLVINAKQKGKKNVEIADWYELKIGTVKKLWRIFQRTGDIQPKQYKGRPSCLTGEQIELIHRKIEAQPDATLAEIIDDLSLPIKKSQLDRWLRANSYSLKKNSTSQRTRTR